MVNSTMLDVGIVDNNVAVVTVGDCVIHKDLYRLCRDMRSGLVLSEQDTKIVGHILQQLLDRPDMSNMRVFATRSSLGNWPRRHYLVHDDNGTDKMVLISKAVADVLIATGMPSGN